MYLELLEIAINQGFITKKDLEDNEFNNDLLIEFIITNTGATIINTKFVTDYYSYDETCEVVISTMEFEEFILS